MEINRRKSALVVEDDEALAFVLTDKLSLLGFECTSVNNGQDAVTLCQANSYDLILMDIHMPILNGIEASKQILEKKLDTLIIAVTSAIEKLEAERMKRIGVKDCLLKPVTLEKLQKVVSAQLGSLR